MADYEQKNIISFELKDRATDKIENIAKGMNGLSSYFEKFGNNATKSFNRLHKSFDRIANIIRYRLIRQGISLLVSQLGEGTKAVYKFAASVRETDQLHIADKLDRYATLLDNIRGNLGATWATFLANMSGYIEPILQKISDSFDKLSAYTAAIGGASEYWSVAEDNAKRYFSTVANGLQDIKVIGQNTQMEKTPIPEDIAESAGKFKQNLALIGDLSETTTKALAIILIGTGHVVAGLELGAVALGIKNLSNQMENNTTKSDVEKTFDDISGLLTSVELGLGFVLTANGHPEYGIPLIISGASGTLRKVQDFDLEEDLKAKFLIGETVLNAISLGLGAILCYFGQYQYGVPMLISGLVGTGMEVAHNWDGIMSAFEELGRKIEIWWWSIWNGLTGKSWAEKVTAFYEAFPELAPESTTNKSGTPLSVKSLTNESESFREKIDSLDKLALAVSDVAEKSVNLEEWADERGSAMADFFQNVATTVGSIGEKIGKLFTGLAYEGFNLRYGGFQRVNKYADGGFPSAGSIFVAGEVPGQTELLGTINGKTGVAGGAEITGIREAIYEVGAEMLSAIRSGNVNVTLEGDADKLFRVIKSKAVDYNRRTGNFAF